MKVKTKLFITAIFTLIFMLCVSVGINAISYKNHGIVLANGTENLTQKVIVDFSMGGDFQKVTATAGEFSGSEIADEDCTLTENGYKVNLSSGWKKARFEFANVLDVSEVGSVTIKFYSHTHSEGTPCMSWKNNDGTQFKWYDLATIDGEVNFVLTGDLLAGFADANGKISGLMFEFNYNGATPYEDSYLEFLSITYTNVTKNVTFHHNVQDVENSIVEVEKNAKATAYPSKKLGYGVTWYKNEGLTEEFDFSTAITNDIDLYAGYTALEEFEYGVITNFKSGEFVKVNATAGEFGGSEIADENCSMTANGYKVKLGNGWLKTRFEFANKISLDDVYSVTIKFYSHTHSAGTPCISWKDNDGVAFKWYDLTVVDGVAEFVLTGDLLAGFADANGKISGLMFEFNYNGATPYEDSYLEFMSVTYKQAYTITFDNGEYGENSSKMVFKGTTVYEPKADKLGYNVVWYKNQERTVLAEFPFQASESKTLYGVYSFVGYADEVREFKNGEIIKVNATEGDFGAGEIADSDCGYTANGYKVKLSSGWIKTRLEFANKIRANNLYSLTIKINVHSHNEGTPCISWKNYDGVQFMWYNLEVGDGEIELVLTEDKIAGMVDSNGFVSGLMFEFNYNGAAPYEDSYLEFLSITYKGAYEVVLDNDTQNTGVENSRMILHEGETLYKPTSQYYNHSVTWYKDEERTILYEFNHVLTEDVILYGKYEDLQLKSGLIANFDKGDVKILDIDIAVGDQGDESHTPLSQTKIDLTNIKYVTNVDVNGDGIVESGIKIVGFNAQWVYFAFELAKPIDIKEVVSVKIRTYSHLADEIYLMICNDKDCGEYAGKPYWTKSVNAWGSEFQDQFDEKYIGIDLLKKLADQDGKIYRFALAFGVSGVYYEDAFFFIDNLTYSYKCTLTLDHDFENTGIENTTKDVESGIISAPQSEKKGYNVVWYKDQARTIEFDFENEEITEDITLYGKYSIKKLTVIIDHDEAKTGIKNEVITINYGDTIEVPTSKINGVQVEWYADAVYIDVFDFDSPITSDITVFAKYLYNNQKSGSGCNGYIQANDTVLIISLILSVAMVIVILKKTKKDN